MGGKNPAKGGGDKGDAAKRFIDALASDDPEAADEALLEITNEIKEQQGKPPQER